MVKMGRGKGVSKKEGGKMRKEVKGRRVVKVETGEG